MQFISLWKTRWSWKKVRIVIVWKEVKVNFWLQLSTCRVCCSSQAVQSAHCITKRKLALFNLTVYEGSQNGYCYMWTEVNGKRDCNEIGPILYWYLSNVSSQVNEISQFYYNCFGQNRNQYIASLLHAVRMLHYDVKEHKFLVPGHTQMQWDSLHSATEYTHKHMWT